jgi:hypothetical protein
VAALGHENVRGFDVAMDYAFCVCCVECVCNLKGERQDQFGVHWPTANAMLQGHSVQKLHGDERVAVLVVNLLDRADIRMIQCRSSFGFALKAAEDLRVFGYLVGQELEGNKPAKLQVLGLVHHAHPTAAELLDDAVVRDGLADQLERHSNLGRQS